MKKNVFNSIILFGLALSLVSCNGQAKKEESKKTTSPTEIQTFETTKLVRTQNSQKSDNVRSILEDRKGNLWIGTTAEGIYKFDGKLFQHYTQRDGLPSNYIFSIIEAKDGKIWIGTENGVSVYDNRSFKDVFITEPENSKHKKFYVFHIMQDKKGKIWFATVEGVFVYDGKAFTPFAVNEGSLGFMSKKNNVEYILEDSTGNIWFGGRNNKGVFRYDGKTITSYPLDVLEGHDWAWPQLEDNQGNLWFSNWGGVYRFDGKSMKSYTKKDGLFDGAVTTIIEDENGSLWVGGQGIIVYDGESFSYPKFKNDTIDKAVSSMKQDSKGNIWVGTRNTGLHRINGNTISDYSNSKPSFSIAPE